MSLGIQYPHLDADERGEVRIGRTRYTVRHLAGEHWHYGWSAEELLRQHPDLRPEEVYAALTWFYDHFDETVVLLRAESAQKAPASTVTRAELQRRRSEVPRS